MIKYSLYVRRIRLCLIEKGVTVKDLRSDLLAMPATNNKKQQLMLLSAHKAELEKATDLNDIFDIINAEYATFLSYDIFQFMLDTYNINQGQEEFKYPEHLSDYLKEHNISEFVEINPLLKKYNTTASTELILKLDIDSTSRLAKVMHLKTTIAKILRLRSAALRLLDIKDGCVVVTFLIPTHVAKVIFNKLTKTEEKLVRALPVLRLECNTCILLEKMQISEENCKV